MALSDQTTIEHVRLRGARADPTVARLRLSHLLSSASLKPPGMLPSAILLVRAMADPLPGRITKAFEPGALASAEWEKAAQDSLGAFYASAYRPMRWAAPANAAAVLFADYAELLACLARDLASGVALGWWWQSILRRIPNRLPGSWIAVWAEHPLYVPSALEHLEARQQAVKVLERIAPVQAWNQLMIVLRAFDLPGLIMARAPTAAMAPIPGAPGTPPNLAQAENAADSPFERTAAVRAQAAHTETAGVTAMARLPWEPYVSRASTPPELGYERQALLGIGLLLRKASQVALTAAFASRFRAWVTAEELKAGEPEGRAPAADASRPSVLPGKSLSGDQAPWEHDRAHHPPLSIPAEGVYLATGKARQPANRLVDSRPDRGPAKASTSANARDWEAGEFTRAGGILYLIHFLRQAELLRHFETGLGGWALLELLAKCLLDDVPNLADDAIWAALAQLDGRDAGTPPGSGFEPRRTYSAPASWLTNDVGPSRFARFRSRGVEVWTAEGFLVLDSQDGELPSGAVQRLACSHRRKLRRPARVRPVSLPVSPELRRFLHFVLPYARRRLDRALQGTPVKDALLRAGKLYVTATHVDLVMPMSEISLPVRLAGLDANPGWAPELGRIVNFHFVQDGYSHG